MVNAGKHGMKSPGKEAGRYLRSGPGNKRAEEGDENEQEDH